tara:strand:+ start:393 stop:1964 length:1572 start_codon:yes stop_codon:yes gene_type:complete
LVSKTNRIIRDLKGQSFEPKTPIATDMYLPNHSGIASHPEMAGEKGFVKKTGDTMTGGLHIQTGNIGATENINADELILENNDHGGLSICTPNDKICTIAFGDPEDTAAGRIQYVHSSNTLRFQTNGGTLALEIDSSQNFDFQTGNLSTTGIITGVNVTSAEDPGHTHTSASAPGAVTSVSGSTGAVVDGDIDHDALANFASNEHFTQANITATGTIASGTWNGTSIGTAYTDAKVTSVSGSTGAVVDGDIDHDSLLNFVANEHIDWTSTSSNFNTSGTGDIGGNTIIGSTTVNPDGTLHVHTATAGTITASNAADDLIVENSGSSGITIFNPAANIGSIFFGTPTSTSDGRIRYDGTVRDLAFSTGTTEKMNISINGEITSTSQPAFLAHNSSIDSNVTGAGTAATVDFDTEIFDQGSNFASDTFTAPVTGRYLLSTSVRYSGGSGASTSTFIFFISSNRIYERLKLPAAISSDGLNLSAVIDMDANDTVFVRLIVNGEASNVIDINGGAVLDTFFSGCLLT